MATEFKFTVNPAELRLTARQAFDLYSELADSALPRDALDGVAGSKPVAHAYEQFVQHWSDGLWKASNLLNDLANRLGAAADAYQQADQAIDQAAGRPRV